MSTSNSRALAGLPSYTDRGQVSRVAAAMTAKRLLQSVRFGMRTSFVMPQPCHPARPVGLFQCMAAKSARGVKEESVYSKTVSLPQTTFDMRANSITREPQIQEFWQNNKVYEGLFDSNPGSLFTLHDGPPYANGDLHIGHALNKILKDIINRYEILQGRKVRFVPGWDCHGLPIELKVLQGMKSKERMELTPLSLRRKARDFALSTVDQQRTQFKRFGIWADWETPYVTLQPAYEAAQLRVFGKMVLNGHIYRGRKPVHWSPSSLTALAEAELEYPEGHVSCSVYVAMALTATGPAVSGDVRDLLNGARFAVWTTTPWTMPANMAIALNPELQYAIVDGQALGKLVVAEGLVDTLSKRFETPLTILRTVRGAELDGCTYQHPLSSRISLIVMGGDYITTETGTGLVHTAPGHGQEDYQVGLRCGLEIFSPVDDAGMFTAEAGEEFAGLSVLGEGNTAVVSALDKVGALLKQEQYAHKYPYDWRTKKPTIFRATDQWFASIEGFRAAALQAIRDVKWVPAVGENRIASMTEGRSDWCISRQRKWGVPIPVFYYTDSGTPLLTEETIAHVTRIVEEHGSDAWWELDVAALLPASLRDQAPLLRKGEDTMDVWFDSGSSWAGVLENSASANYPADLYLEGSDQHRGWFQSSLLTSVAATGSAPFRQVLTHGFVLDERGVKMSKSLGNVVDPRTVIIGGKDAKKEPAYGADVLRLWVASVDYSSDVSIGTRIISQTADTYRKLRGTLRFLLGNLHDFNPEVDRVPYSELPSVDRYILSRFSALLDESAAHYASFQFSRLVQGLLRFTVLDLSNFYLDAAKDRLYIQAGRSPGRRACQTVLHELLQGMLPIIAPVLPHMAEDAWQNLPYQAPQTSVFQAGWVAAKTEWGSLSEGDAAVWKAVSAFRSELNLLLERARGDKALGASLEAKVSLYVADPTLRQSLQRLQESDNGADALRYAFIISQADVALTADEATSGFPYSTTVEVEGVGSVSIGVGRAEGAKCARCWNYSHHIRHSKQHPELCERCAPVVVKAEHGTAVLA